MTAELERSYTRLLRLYPAGYRRERGDEMLDVLLASGATRLSLRERRALILGALRCRAGATGRRDLGTTWRQSAALAACMLMAFGAVSTVAREIAWPAGPDWRECVAAALGLAGILVAFRGWLPAAIGCAVAAYLFPMLSDGRLTYSWSVEWLLAAVLLIPAAVRGGRPPWRQAYLLVLPLALLEPSLVPSPLQTGWIVLLAAVLAWTVLDERAALAFGLMLTLGLADQGVAALSGLGFETTYVAMWVGWPGAMLVAGSVVARRRARI
ncbi:hypothetical protein [Paractinoplanes toevensis]|uniref:Uncharacterized protein n=1 Tax=Paractinoplanes toevensis TaxID=571911 RepID=A0A919T962_9ACTN|nr:hypothetical protein [Actinoplanes toevensis]GIM90391.1 hypothetical protein Ato02nite_021840 [Actinoplanes toevensis]